MTPVLNTIIFVICFISYIIAIGYCAYKCRTKNDVKNSSDYVEV